MKASFLRCRFSAPFLAVAFGILLFPADATQLVSQADGTLAGANHSNGDSGPSIISPDGRYVLFSSAANNLVATAAANPIPLLIPAPLNVYLRDRTSGVTTLVSVNVTGSGGNGDSFAMGVSSNGQYAVFESSASDLVAGDTNNANDVFVRDVLNGTTTLVSVSTKGGVGNGTSRTPVMTPDGRYVAFVSSASNLVPGDTNSIPDIFVRDLQLGTTTLASPGAQSTGATAASGSAAPAITPDGSRVVFYSSATNLVPGLTNVGDIYVRDLVAGTTYWASSGARSVLQSVFGAASGVCFGPRISSDGTWVAYEVSEVAYGNTAGAVLRCHLPDGLTDVVNTNANAPKVNYEDVRTVDLSSDGQYVAAVINTDSQGINTAIYQWDANDGTTLLASPALTSSVPANGISYAPVMDESGRYIAFLSDSTNLTTNILSGPVHLYCFDTQDGATFLVDVDTNGVGLGVNAETFPSWSTNAQFLAYESAGAGDRNQYVNVVVHNLASNSTEIASSSAPVFAFPSADGPSVLFGGSIGTTARYVALASDADNLASGATNGYRNVIVCDLVMGTNALVSVNTNGFAAAGNSSQPSLGGDGRFVAFTSTASDLVPGDTNSSCDVFVRDVQSGITTLVSVNLNGSGPGNTNSFSPIISSDGRFVLFYSLADNLAAGSFGSGSTNLFLRDLQLDTTFALTAANTANGVTTAAMTPDGRYVAFCGRPPGTAAPSLYVWDSESASLVYTNNTASLLQVAISPDGQRLACITANPGNLLLDDLQAATNDATICTAKFPSLPGLSFSADGRFLAYATNTTTSSQPTNGVGQVFVYDVLAKTNQLISRNVTGSGGGNGPSDSPVMSPDGRFVAYRSFATNLVSGDSNGVPNLLLYDRSSGTTTLLTTSLFGGGPEANRSSHPCFSPDGQTLVFQSAGFDLVTNDFNRSGDILAFNLFTGGVIPVFQLQTIPGSPASKPTLLWPVLPGKFYQVLFKNSLSDPAWQPLPGNITFFGNTARFTDSNPAGAQRFYQIVGR
jgi:Tol biopolymer transport system component